MKTLLVKCPPAQWQPDGLTIRTEKWFLKARFPGVPPISFIKGGGAPTPPIPRKRDPSGAIITTPYSYTDTYGYNHHVTAIISVTSITTLSPIAELAPAEATASSQEFNLENGPSPWEILTFKGHFILK